MNKRQKKKLEKRWGFRHYRDFKKYYNMKGAELIELFDKEIHRLYERMNEAIFPPFPNMDVEPNPEISEFVRDLVRITVKTSGVPPSLIGYMYNQETIDAIEAEGWGVVNE